jgi:ATP-binding cassette subfamily C protein LapB
VTYYSNPELLKSDLNWLSKDCTLEHFSSNRLSDYEYRKLLSEIAQRVDNSFVERLFNRLLSKLSLQSSVWEDALESHMLPALALIPGVGIRVIIGIDVNGVYKSIGENGTTEHLSFASNSIFRMLRFQAKESVFISAKAMFGSIAKEQKKYLYYAIIASVSINLLALAASFYSMQVYDRVIPTNGISTLVALTVGVGLAIFLEMILKLSRGSIIDQASKNMDIKYSHDIFDRFLSIRSDNMPKGIGSLSSKINSYVAVRGFITTAVIFIFIDFPFAFFFLGILTLVGGVEIGQLILAFIITAILIGLIFKNKIEALIKSSTLASHKKHGLLVESVENAQKIKTTGAGWSVMNKWSQFTEDAIDDDIRVKRYTDISTNLATFVQQISYAATVALGAYLIGSTSDLTMGSLIAITILSNKVFQPMSQIPGLFVQWGKAKVAIEDLDGLYKLASDNEGVDRPITSQLQSHGVVCKDLKFAYNQDSATLLNIPNLQIWPGEKVAVLGVIGAGKSTLLKTLSGLYKPTSGKVLLDSIDMQQLSKDNISNTIGYLEQDTKLFAGTLRDNLSIGLIGITDERILTVCKLTGLIGLISALPKGLDTEVPEGGESVSGGQRQLIALTRMLVGNSKILLLDEPTASMDEGTERHILTVLHQNLTKEQTLVVVTHKPALLGLVDRIVIMTEKGIVADDKKENVLKMLENNQTRQTTQS